MVPEQTDSHPEAERPTVLDAQTRFPQMKEFPLGHKIQKGSKIKGRYVQGRVSVKGPETDFVQHL